MCVIIYLAVGSKYMYLSIAYAYQSARTFFSDVVLRKNEVVIPLYGRVSIALPVGLIYVLVVCAVCISAKDLRGLEPGTCCLDIGSATCRCDCGPRSVARHFGCCCCCWIVVLRPR